ncbi:vacuolar protein-sorting-associated protein 33 homolog [Ricinus communis]|uniref:Vacuolar protein sorting, putative n=1 Tax=Ricinus communis TaxID=3988 RepID=B9S0W7_RICCO|nr:vacuolar protein-sorting-associated protein 33 homolog [Ricinus communis]XP_015574935.1 vacuolar protein-sorting-associated protein 33 homolog [Ricinus communis]XP_048231996.1 vacuolar protein-sorting-associated protein 33 homolog [Ricinus communis]XP_048231997.1 vacuolar protein-sorting-associated protein 33 homolog [Ricinus communis]EEF42781.1 vacuolar protein sorting, putative [Ricinus communis]|eukprot:XP_002519636.1 vacuolar protein-sorting-associated protein 33 homolog [Ricinus communis]
MAQIPNLDNSPLNLRSLREQSQKELVNILRNIRGNKCLVIDPKLSGSLSLIIQTSILREHGAELRHLSADPIQTDCTKVVYLVRSRFNLMRFICSHVHNDTSKGLEREYYIYFVPRREVVCEKVLEEEKIHHLMTIGEYPLYMVPLDEDVLSFELDVTSKKYQVDGDTSSLWHIAKAIHRLESSFGVIPHVRAKGKASVRVADILNHMQTEEPINSSDMGVPEINTLILLDREVDMVTPMCSQLTYEGLLDEFLHINNGAVELDASVMGAQQQEGKKMKVPLNSSDKLFKEIRDLNFEVVVQVLRQKATSMKQDYTEMTTTNQTVSELKDFVKKLNSLPEMTRHINLAQHLSTFTSKPSFLARLDMEHTIVEAENYDACFEHIEELIHKQEPLVTVLRMLILLSVTNSGLPRKNFDYIRRELLHSYGFEHMATLNNLEKAGLLKKQESRSNWVTIKRALQLVVEDTDTANPNDIAYVFSGYAPLSIRLVQHAVRSGWRPMEEILKLLPGPHSETKRAGFTSSPSSNTLNGAGATVDRVADGRRSLVLVVFIGGVTFAEISALRFLSAQEGMAYDLIIGTTELVNGNTLAETYLEHLG